MSIAMSVARERAKRCHWNLPWPGRARLALVGGLLVALSGAACDDANTPEQDFTSAWRSAGYEVEDMAKVAESPIGGEACWSARVDKLDTLFCRYKDDAAAAQAHASGLQYVGENTGLALNQKRWMIVVVDRDKTDPKGKSLNRVAKTFLGHKRVLKDPDKKKKKKSDGE